MNRDSHNIHRAYQKSRLLREENNEENFPDNEEDGTEDTGLSELEAWEKKHRLPREYQDEQYSGQPTLEFYFNKRMDELVDEFDCPRVW